MKLYKTLILIFISVYTYSQDFSWEYVNPWTYNHISSIKKCNDRLFFIDYTQSDDSYLIEKLPEIYDFDTIANFGSIEIGDFAVLENQDIYISISTGNNLFGIANFNSDNNTFEVIFESSSFLDLYSLNNSLIIHEKPSPSSSISQISVLKNEEINIIYDYEFDFNEIPKLEVQDNVIHFHRDRDFYFSLDEGTSWIYINADNYVKRCSIIDEKLYLLGGFNNFIYNFEGIKIDSFFFNNNNDPYYIPSPLALEKISDVLYLSASDALVKSEDDGATWEIITENKNRRNRWLTQFQKNGNNLFFGSFVGLELYNPASEQIIPMNNQQIFGSDFSFMVNDSSFIIYNFNDTGNNELYRSSNGGLTWEKEYIDFFEEDFDNGNIMFQENSDTYFLANRVKKELYRSDDQGYNWYLYKDMQNSAYDFFHINSPTHYYSYDNQSVQFSSDGENWINLIVDFDTPSPGRFTFVDGKDDYTWICAKDFPADSIYIYLVEGNKILKKETFKTTDTHPEFTISEDGIFISTSGFIKLLYYDDNENENYPNPNKVKVVKELSDGYLVTKSDFLYRYDNLGVLPNSEPQRVQKNAIYHSQANYFENSKEEILMINNDNRQQILKYGPPIDKGIFTGPEEIPYVQDEQLIIYPNPFHDFIVIDSDKTMHHTLYSIDGQLVLQSYDNMIYTADLQNGMYVLVSYENGRIVNTRKLVK